MDTNVFVSETDILTIGTIINNKDDNATIVCDSATATISKILLRSILKCFGKEYKIIDKSDYEWEDGTVDIAYKTNLPIREVIKANKTLLESPDYDGEGNHKYKDLFWFYKEE